MIDTDMTIVVVLRNQLFGQSRMTIVKRDIKFDQRPPESFPQKTLVRYTTAIFLILEILIIIITIAEA